MKDWDKKAFIESSSYRKKIYEALKQEPRTPKELKEITKINFSHVSRALVELEEKGFVKCLTSKDIRKNKIYGIK